MVAQNALPAATAGGIDAAAAEVLKATGVPSASVAVVQGGKVAYVKAYGMARLDPPMPAEPGMQYSVGSISKQFTAAMMLLLVQDGKVKLDDPLGKYLPGLTRANEVTIRQVLSMTSGYQDFWPEDYVMTSMMKPTDPQHILEVWGKKPLDFEPGTQWQYSNTNYVIAGRIVEIVGGKPLIEQLQDRIFRPLKMTGVFNSDASRLPANDPTGYYQHALGPLRPAPLEGQGWMFAAGELAMPASDLALWNISMIDRTLLSQASYDAMFTEVKLKDGKGTGYGLGVQVGNRNGHRYIEHSGEVSGFVAENIVFPDDKVAVTVLTNEDASERCGCAGPQDCAAGDGRGVECGWCGCGDGGGGEAGAGYFYWIAGWQAGSDAIDGVVRCLLYGGGGAGLCFEPETAGCAEQLQAGSGGQARRDDVSGL